MALAKRSSGRGPAETPPALQAGGRWFEPGTAHPPAMRDCGPLRYRSGRGQCPTSAPNAQGSFLVVVELLELSRGRGAFEPTPRLLRRHDITASKVGLRAPDRGSRCRLAVLPRRPRARRRRGVDGARPGRAAERERRHRARADRARGRPAPAAAPDGYRARARRLSRRRGLRASRPSRLLRQGAARGPPVGQARLRGDRPGWGARERVRPEAVASAHSALVPGPPARRTEVYGMPHLPALYAEASFADTNHVQRPLSRTACELSVIGPTVSLSVVLIE